MAQEKKMLSFSAEKGPSEDQFKKLKISHLINKKKNNYENAKAICKFYDDLYNDTDTVCIITETQLAHPAGSLSVHSAPHTPHITSLQSAHGPKVISLEWRRTWMASICSFIAQRNMRNNPISKAILSNLINSRPKSENMRIHFTTKTLRSPRKHWIKTSKADATSYAVHTISLMCFVDSMISFKWR
eukprot:123061_1